MKKFILILLGFFAAFFVVACQSEPSVLSSEEDSNMISQQTEEVESDSSLGNAIAENPVKPQVRENCDFRNAKWGDSQEDVKKYELEITDFVHGTDSEAVFAGETTVSGYSAVALFHFDNNKLYMGMYAFDLNYSNAGQYIPVYNVLKENLIKKYGEPTVDMIIPLADERLIEMAGDASALEYGYVQYGAVWETSSSVIQLMMGAQNYDITLGIQYTDKYYSGSGNNGL